MSPFDPKGKEKKLPSSLLKMYQKPSDGLKKATSAFPSPVKSPGVMMSVERQISEINEPVAGNYAFAELTMELGTL